MIHHGILSAHGIFTSITREIEEILENDAVKKSRE